MTARHTRAPTPRMVRRAVKMLALLGSDALAALAEAAIEEMDAVTPDPDMEPDADMQSTLGCGLANPSRTGTGDAEDAEHSLGWHGASHNLVLHGAPEGGDVDLEEDDPQGDARHDADAEPSLGWSSGNGGLIPDLARHRLQGAIYDDLEEQCEDEGYLESDGDLDDPDSSVFGVGAVTGPDLCGELRL